MKEAARQRSVKTWEGRRDVKGKEKEGKRKGNS